MYSGPSSTEEVQELVSKVLKLEGVRTMTRVTHTMRKYVKCVSILLHSLPISLALKYMCDVLVYA